MCGGGKEVVRRLRRGVCGVLEGCGGGSRGLEPVSSYSVRRMGIVVSWWSWKVGCLLLWCRLRRGSDGHWQGGGFQQDVHVDEGIGEGIEVLHGVEVTLVGDLSSIVLEDGEGPFGDGAGFVGVLEVG